MRSIAHPWYREPWPWIVMSGPAVVVVACLATAALAVTSNDGLVADDYYRQGLAINRVIAREAYAQRVGVSGTAAFTEERDRVRVVLAAGERPASLRLSLVHPTLQAQDQAIVLASVAPGVYEGILRPPRRAATLRANLEDVDGHWRVAATWDTREPTLRFEP